MREAHEDLHVRHTPPTTQDYNRKVRWHDEDRIHITVWRDGKPPKREMEENGQDGTSETWFKITVPCGRKYDKTWLLDSIQSHCSVPFTPVDFHYVKMQAQFFVQDINTASALKNISYKIHDDENQKICIFVNHSIVPHSVQNKLKPEQLEQLKLTMNKRYDVFKQALDLQSFRFDPDLVDHDIDMILNRRHCMAITLNIIEENFPELLSLDLRSNKLYQLDGLSDIIQKAPKVKILNLSKNKLKSAWELDKIKGLELKELCLEGNPLCNNFSDHSAYVRAIRDCFPKLLCLDGQQLDASLTVEIEVPDIMRPCKESYKGSETLKNLVLQFLQQYYWIYDYGDRQGLLDAYHDEACFSLTIPFNPEDPAPVSLDKYSKRSRNMKKRKDPILRVQLLKHTKHDVVDSLSMLPKTQHDFSSFVVDMCVQTEKMLCFSVNGVFKEVEGMPQVHVRGFTRIFIAISASNFNLCIVNDQLFVRDASPEETLNASFIPVPAPSSSSVPILPKEQQEMVQAFSTQSRMKFEWSWKCLEDNEWDYVRAGQVFSILKPEATSMTGDGGQADQEAEDNLSACPEPPKGPAVLFLTILEQKGGLWLTAGRMAHSQAQLLDNPKVTLKVTSTLNPAGLLLTNSASEPVQDCLQTIEEVYSSQPHLSNQPITNPDLTLYPDGSKFIKNGTRKADYTVVTPTNVLKACPLLPGASAQKELIALTQALQIVVGETANVYTDSRYAVSVLHAHRAIGKNRAFQHQLGKTFKYAPEILALLEAVKTPTQAVVMHCLGHKRNFRYCLR
ncbi:nuclear RNA export factor 2-like [Elephas maximus indicus]|uniref:nuclear RNA export factor 2-like n=1 Tax=Elephas maximus indicus TaxID=99487 RepID=UPI002116A672|nr:nuclear RNA export factor 2-like [Elephas maximus indicus]